MQRHGTMILITYVLTGESVLKQMSNVSWSLLQISAFPYYRPMTFFIINDRLSAAYSTWKVSCILQRDFALYTKLSLLIRAFDWNRNNIRFLYGTRYLNLNVREKFECKIRTSSRSEWTLNAKGASSSLEVKRTSRSVKWPESYANLSRLEAFPYRWDGELRLPANDKVFFPSQAAHSSP